ncbi:unnamed protein product, partial [Laminaria digitata]
PPVRTRFKPGESGNRRGRPKGAKNKVPALNEERLKNIILEEAYRAIRINDGDRQIKVPMAQAIVRTIAINAVKGQQRAQKLFTEMLTTTERENRADYLRGVEALIDYKIGWERELERWRIHGITDRREPVLHPDQIVVDPREGTVQIVGPQSEQEREQWNLLKSRRGAIEAELHMLEEQAEDPRRPDRKAILKNIKLAKRTLDHIDQL